VKLPEIRLPKMPEAESGSDKPSVFTKVFQSRVVTMSDAHTGSKPEQPPLLELKPQRRRMVQELSLDLLEDRVGKPTSGDIQANQEKIQKTLQNFGIDVEMGTVNVGPTVTQYTLAPAEGVKLASITALSNDLALALAAHPIRIEAPIPGKSLVGIEVPNQAVATVGLKEILSSEAFKKRASNLTISVGKDVAGGAFVADIDRMPHLLIAGSTGSGKSVCINTIIVSLLYTNSPDDLKLILVDPKRVELTPYNDIPHLLTPVITDTTNTINALKWVVAEMDRRYLVLNQAAKRNLASYNQSAEDKLPYLLVVIDELADLMAVAAADVETAIIRLAQMARAVGIHLVVATQRPSVDVITGLIKANITSRIAFAVASGTDSRTILDTSGAEKLLGRGDCLFVSAELSKPKRLQGAFISDAEIERVTAALKQEAQPDYNPEVVVKRGGSSVVGGSSADDSDDELLGEAKAEVVRAGKASASLLQRRLRVGYARAARLLDLLEERGIIGPGDGAKPRDVLVSRRDIEQDFASMPEESTMEEESDAEDVAPEAESPDREPEETL
jgi:S-DNA-T family DNA segregation ATPase FtsK/SpoIIIE